MSFKINRSIRSSIRFRSRANSILLRNYLRTEFARTNNLVVTGYPKSGTTWVTQLMAHLAELDFHQGEPRFRLNGVALHTHAVNFYGTKRILYAVRDPRETICSAARALLAHDVQGILSADGHLTEEFIHYAITRHEGARNSMRDHLQSAIDQGWNSVRFEDLKTDPNATLERVLKNLGISAYSGEISIAVEAYDFSRRRAQSEEKWFFAGSSIESWKELLSLNSLDYLEKKIGEQASAFNYDLTTRP